MARRTIIKVHIFIEYISFSSPMMVARTSRRLQAQRRGGKPDYPGAHGADGASNITQSHRTAWQFRRHVSGSTSPDIMAYVPPDRVPAIGQLTPRVLFMDDLSVCLTFGHGVDSSDGDG